MTDDKKKSPLDILEDVLKDAKSVSKAKQDVAQVDNDKKQQQELAQLREQKAAEDEHLIQEQLVKMKQISQMPSEQARQAQDKAEQTESKKQKSSQEGYKIHQLGHTKA